MPDLFSGDAAPVATTFSDEAGSILDQVRLRAVEAAKSFMIDMWMARHTPEKVLPVLHRVIDGCREKFADAVRHGDGIYAVGYCVGGRHVLLLGSETPGPADADADEEAGAVRRGPWIKAGALAHAASVSPDDFTNLKGARQSCLRRERPALPGRCQDGGRRFDGFGESRARGQGVPRRAPW